MNLNEMWTWIDAQICAMSLTRFPISGFTAQPRNKSDSYHSDPSARKKTRQVLANDEIGGTASEARPHHTRCLDYLQISREIYTAVQRFYPRLAHLSPLPSGFFLTRPAAQPLFAVAELIGKITRLGEEAKLTPDAMPETRMQPGKEETRGGRRIGGGWRKEGKVVVSGYWEVYAIIVRRSLQKVPGTSGSKRGIRSRIRASILDPRRAERRPRTTKCLSERNFRKVKALQGGERRVANASCKLRKTRVTKFMARIPVIVSSFIPRRTAETEV